MECVACGNKIKNMKRIRERGTTKWLYDNGVVKILLCSQKCLDEVKNSNDPEDYDIGDPFDENNDYDSDWKPLIKLRG